MKVSDNGWKSWVISALFAMVLLFLSLAGNAYRKDIERNRVRIDTMTMNYGERLASMEARMAMMQQTLDKIDRKLDDLK